ncbi:MAG TPA: hypothetical protein VE092_18355 [Herbaspirillum sp.]|uniref:hypothetical protein n=1 Tax=Herbaspirillum sp. TaxID=1890675 RepID=UPI002D44102C|nr:hypothetical protein [Herbaspirillum sp.]HZG21979.1 hypothetical protein [Herbaspirillum sp.]
MEISGTRAPALAVAVPPSPAPQVAADSGTRQEEVSAKVTISSQALQKAGEEGVPTDEMASPYRLTGPATLVSSLHPFVYQMPEALIKEMAVRAKEEAARNEVSSQYAREHQYQTVGQVLVNGKLFAEVNDAGGYGFAKNSIPGLSQASLKPQERLEEIAQAAKGQGNVEIKYSDFVPGLGGSEGPGAPESVLPAFTARNIHEIFAAAIEAAERQRASTLPTSESAGS